MKRILYNIILILLVITCLLFHLQSVVHCDTKEELSDTQHLSTTISADIELEDSTKNHKELVDPELVKQELKHVFSIDIDKDKDGFASYEEIRNHMIVLNDKRIDYSVDSQWQLYSPQIHEVFSWEGYEPEIKEVLTWEHYFNQTYPELIGISIAGIPLKQEQDTSKIVISKDPHAETTTTTKTTQNLPKQNSENDDDSDRIQMLTQMARRADARWKLADENGDTLLTRDEFKYLWHPEEGNEDLQKLFIKEATEDVDSNGNSRIEFDEFVSHLNELASDEERKNIDWFESQKENFRKVLDKNKDGFLEGDEIKDWLIPEKSKKFEAEAKRLFDIGDKNEDLRLSIAEIFENQESFLSLLPPEYWASENDESSSDFENSAPHDEL